MPLPAVSPNRTLDQKGEGKNHSDPEPVKDALIWSNNTLLEDSQTLLKNESCIPEYDADYCFSGQCFMLRTNGRDGGYLLGPFCRCDPGWFGYRCKYMLHGSISQRSQNSSKMVARTLGLSFAGIILLAIAAVLIIAYHHKKKRPKRGQRQDIGNYIAAASQKFHDVRQKKLRFQADIDGSHKLIDADELQLQRQVMTDGGKLNTICHQKPPVPLSRPATTILAAPWPQVSLGSPVASKSKCSSIIHWTFSRQGSRTVHEISSNGCAI